MSLFKKFINKITSIKKKCISSDNVLTIGLSVHKVCGIVHKKIEKERQCSTTFVNTKYI
jgi:hypothetical protein